VASQAGHDDCATQKENMIAFLKITPEAGERMWLYVRWWSACKHEKSLKYQVSAKTLKSDREKAKTN
jgi:hypothetical protein